MCTRWYTFAFQFICWCAVASWSCSQLFTLHLPLDEGTRTVQGTCVFADFLLHLSENIDTVLEGKVVPFGLIHFGFKQWWTWAWYQLCIKSTIVFFANMASVGYLNNKYYKIHNFSCFLLSTVHASFLGCAKLILCFVWICTNNVIQRKRSRYWFISVLRPPAQTMINGCFRNLL